MRDVSIARNYAEAALVLARKGGDADGWGAFLNGYADLVEREPVVRKFLAAPQVSAEAKNAVLGKAFGDKVPALLVRFVQKLVANRRQMLLPEIAVEYGNLRDAEEGRVHARVTVARALSDDDLQALTARLGKALGKTIVPHVTTDAALLGGVVIRVGDTVMDGSVRKRLQTLRGRMLAGR